MTALLPKNWAIGGWAYNRTNFQYDQKMRWQRYTSGRKQAMSQIDMFREDIADLSGVSTAKLKTYGPIYGIVTTVCVTVLVEGRSGLKFPGPPVFISGIYLQCLAIGMGFVALATWLLFHAAMRAQIACVQLRTRIVRLPVATQRQLDGARKLASTYEEQGLYDMFRIPFVMPNGANSPENSDEEEEDETAAKHGYNKGGLPGVAHKLQTQLKNAHDKGHTHHSARMPGFTPGNPAWYEKELEDREAVPESSPSGHGNSGLEEPYAHFELIREAQKEWWGCEAYMRVCFLYGMMHLIMAFSYWITLHNIAELGMIWCSNMGAAGLTAGVWIIFRMDVLPEYGGAFPVEIGGPFVTSIALGLMYSQQYTQTMMDIARGVAILIVIMHILLTFRMYAVAKPTNGKAHHQALETGGRLFNQSASCEAPSWLPSAFQHVMYLIAPPKTEEQLEQERLDRENAHIADEAMAKVDMKPWYYLRTMIFAVGVGWTLQLTGRTIECVMGERMLVSNPGSPPWTRAGQWYGWEHGPITSKHYAHVTPQRGHWAWQQGWGPQGQQELWASDMFGFAPEADSWWAEDVGPEPKVGIAGVGENTWASGVLAYGQGEAKWGAHHESNHDWSESGGHRRLFGMEVQPARVSMAPRAVVPVPVQWPALMEPDHIACGKGGVLALTSGGAGALVPPSAVSGQSVGSTTALILEGLMELGLARSIAWGREGLLAVTGSGHVATCPIAAGKGSARCSRIAAPRLPDFYGPATVSEHGPALGAVVADRDGRIALLKLIQSGFDVTWEEVGSVHVPHEQPDIVSISADADHLLVTLNSGAAYQWALQDFLPTSTAPTHDIPIGSQRKWHSACRLPNSKILRLASTWQRSTGGASQLLPELLL